MIPEPPQRMVKFGDTSATEEDFLKFGFMPEEEDLERSVKNNRDVCTRVATLKIPLSGGRIDIVVEPEDTKRASRRGDTLKLRIGDLVSPDFAGLSAQSLRVVKDFFTVFFDILIEQATHLETGSDTLVSEQLEISDLRLQDEPTVEFNDYIRARVSVNKFAKRRRKKLGIYQNYNHKRSTFDKALGAIQEQQGFNNDEHDDTGLD